MILMSQMILLMSLLPLFFLVSETRNLLSPAVNMPIGLEGGRMDGYLYYRKRANDNWVLIANWCFYGLYIVVRYRKPVWLRAMYRSLFAKMNFVSVTFFDHSFELVGTEGEILRSRRFRLSPPLALDQVMTERFGYNREKVEQLKAKSHL
jgi:hypothetical protein